MQQKEEKLKYIYLGRKSTDMKGKQEQSLETQDNWKQEIVAEEGLNIVVEVVSKESATKSAWRDDFEHVLDMVEEWIGNAILAIRVDRIARNSIDDGRVRQLIRDGKLKEIKTKSHTYTRRDLLFLVIQFEMATEEAETNKVRFNEGKETKKKSGAILHWTPIWYRNVLKQAEIDEKYANYIVYIFEQRAQGKTMVQIANSVNMMGMRSRSIFTEDGVNIGNKPMTKASIERILKNTFYYGVVEIKWELFQGIHTPIITKNLFDKVQLLNRWIVFNKKELTLLKWKVKYYDTKEPLTVSLIKWKYIYFHLHGDKKEKFWYNQSELVKEFDKIIHYYVFPDDFKPLLIEQIKKEVWNTLKSNQKEKELILNSLKEANKKKNSYIEMRSSWEITSEEFLEKKNNLVNGIKDMQERLSEIERQENIKLDIFDEFVELVNNTVQKRKTFSIAKKIAMIDHYAVELFLDKEKRLYNEENPVYACLRVLNGRTNRTVVEVLNLARYMLSNRSCIEKMVENLKRIELILK